MLSDIDKEGLFRISGSKKRQEDLKELVDKDIFIDLESGKFTAHDVATVLKQFLAELPEPLLTPELHHAFLQVAGEAGIMLLPSIKKPSDCIINAFLVPVWHFLKHELNQSWHCHRGTAHWSGNNCNNVIGNL